MTTTIKRKIVGLFGTNLFQINNCVLLSQGFVILMIIFGCFWRIHPSKTSDESTVRWEFCVGQRDTIFLHQDYKRVDLYKILRLFILGRSLRDGKTTFFSQMAQKRYLLIKVWENLLFYHQYQPLYDPMRKEIESLEFVWGVNFEFIESLKNNGF